MITNTLINLTPESRERIDAENFIKYTLLFNYDLPTSDPSSPQIIEEILTQTQLCCCNLFGNNNHYTYNFFGTLIPEEPDSLLYRLTSPKIENKVELHHMLLQNCVMSAYHAILTEYISSLGVTSYTLNKLKNGGAFTAIKNDAISYNKDIKLSSKKLPFNSTDNRNKSSKAADINKNLINKYTNCSPYMSFLYSNDIEKNTKNPKYLLQFSTLSKSISKINTNYFKNLFNIENKVKSSDTIYNTIQNFIKNLTPAISKFSSIIERNFKDFGKNIVDGIYQYYIAEKAYNINLFYSITQNIVLSKSKHNYQFNSNELLKTICSIKKLPNSFSRTYFLRFAFDHITDTCQSYYDYWFCHNIEDYNAVVKDIHNLPKEFQFNKWERQFEQFVNYMSEHVIPIYDWCFITMLLHIIENAYPKYDHNFHLETALHILGKYIYENYQKIMQPIKLDKEELMNGIDIISSKTFDIFKNESLEDYIIQLYKIFFSPLDTELNIRPINLQLYKGKAIKDTNIISDFYCDLRFGYK